MKGVVVLFDGSERTVATLPVGRALAQLEEASVHVVYPGSAQDGQAALTRWGLEPAEDLVVHGADERVAEIALQASRELDGAYIVLSTRDANDPPEVGLGRDARAVLAGARSPVVLVRPERGEAEWMLEELLVPHDGTPATSAAICPAGELARRVGAHLFALHVAAPGRTRPREPGSLTVPRYVDQPQHEWPTWAAEFMERVASMCPLDPTRLRFFLAKGEPASEIVRIATDHGVDLIVLAWHGTLASEHASVFKTLLRRSPCPMLVLRVPPPEERGA